MFKLTLGERKTLTKVSTRKPLTNIPQRTVHAPYATVTQIFRNKETGKKNLAAGLVSSVHLTGRPAVPKGPASPKTEEGLWGYGGAPAWPDVPGPSHIGGPMETEGDKPLEQEGINLDATIPAFTSEDTAAVVISDEEVTCFPGGWPEAISTPKIEVAWDHK